MLSQRHNAEHAWRIGTLASSTAHVNTSCKMIQQKTRSISRPCWISSLSRTFTSGRADHTVTGTGRRKVIKNTTLQNNFKRDVSRNTTKTFTIDLSVTSSSERLWSSWVALKKSSLKWIDLQAETTVILPQEEIDVYRGNWWIRSNLVNFDTMPTRLRPDFKKALSTLHRLKKAEDKAHYENWSKSSSSWWQWQTTWWHPYYETSPQRWTEHWSNGETCVISESSIYLWHESHKRIWCTIYSDYIGNSQRSSLSPTVV